MSNYLSAKNFGPEILTNFAAQHANNKARIIELRRYATDGFARVFDQAPFLLNVNDPGLPGYVPDHETPCGVRFAERQLWLPENTRGPGPGTQPSKRPVVESLFLIGSSGSVGHNASSDLDYWVCHEAATFTPRQMELFLHKLAAIKDWAENEHHTEANFYMVNLQDLIQGRLTKLNDAETEGEVAPLLLLEELYRTFLFVAGRPPLWQGLPRSVGADRYSELCGILASHPNPEFVDLGFPALPAPQEILAAALWLARKSEADPFKGILKIVALLDYVESDFTRELLCDQVKEAIFNTPTEEFPVDPYIMTIDRVAKYGEVRLTPEQLELLRLSAALKIMGDQSVQSFFTLPEHSSKRKILHCWSQQWGWAKERIEHLSQYHFWPERARLQLGGELLNMLSSVCVRISQHLALKYPGQVNPQNQELAPLAARLLSRMGGLDATVETLPSQLHQSTISHSLVLRKELETGFWHLHAVDGKGEAPCTDNLIYSSTRAARTAAWLIHNHIYGPETKLQLRWEAGDTGQLRPEVLTELLLILDKAFPTFNLHCSDDGNLWSSGARGFIVLALNLELTPEEFPDLTTIDLVLRTGWGEMRHYLIDVSLYTSIADKCLKIVQTILLGTGSRPHPDDLIFHHPPSPEMRKAVMNIKGSLAAAAKKGRSGFEKKSRIDI